MWNNCVGIKKYNLIIKKKKKKHGEIVSSVKTYLDCMKGLISRSLFNSYISLYDFNLINDVLRKYDDIKKEIKI